MKSLRDIAFDVNGADTTYLTHSLHPYPAKFPPQIPYQILKRFAKVGDSVLDPFCGSGTTLLEARLLGVSSVGIDINGLACLISKVKITPLTPAQIKTLDTVLSTLSTDSVMWQMGARQPITIPDIPSITHWFQKNVIEELGLLRERIWKIEDADVKDFLKIVMASLIVRVSNQESDTRFAAIKKAVPDGFTLHHFLTRAREFRQRIVDLSQDLNGNSARAIVHNADSRNLPFLANNTFDLIITSPPYANTYDYYLYHKFRKYWLDLDVEFAQQNEIGSRREFSSLKQDPIKWINDLRLCFNEMHRVLKVGAPCFIVIGDSVINKEFLRMDQLISSLAPEVGFLVRDIVSTNLNNHSKVFNPAFTKLGKKEHILFLEKQNG